MHVIFEAGGQIVAAQAFGQFPDLPDVATRPPGDLPVSHHCDGNVAPLAHGPHHLKAGQFKQLVRLREIVRAFGHQPQLDRSGGFATEFHFDQFSAGFLPLDGHQLHARLIRPDQFGVGRQAQLEAVELPAEAAARLV